MNFSESISPKIDRSISRQTDLQTGKWTSENILQLLSPSAENSLEVEKLTQKLRITLSPTEEIMHADFNIPAESARKMWLQVGILLVILPIISLTRVPLPLVVCLTIGAAFVAAAIISKSVSLTNLWVITNKRVLKLNKDAINEYPLLKIRLYGRAVEGGCIAFYLGRTTMSRVTIYFPRDPKKMLEVLCEQVDLHKNNKGGK